MSGAAPAGLAQDPVKDGKVRAWIEANISDDILRFEQQASLAR